MTAARLSTTATDRYDSVAQWLHWITAILVLATLPVAWVMINMAHDNRWLQTLFLIHKSLGVTIFAVVALRILWRGLHPAPPLSWTLEPWEAWFARSSHVLLYLLLLAMPISGYITSAASNHPVNYFGLVTLPSLPLNKPLADAAGEIHEISSWALYALIGVHVLGTAYHVILKRDGVLNRMLPEQINAD
jgi:cytochrome b561